MTAFDFSNVAVKELTAAEWAELAEIRAEIAEMSLELGDIYEGVSDEEMAELRELREAFLTADEIGSRYDEAQDAADEAAAQEDAAHEEYLNSLDEDAYQAATAVDWGDRTELHADIQGLFHAMDETDRFHQANKRALGMTA